jgi:hypothetical protein
MQSVAFSGHLQQSGASSLLCDQWHTWNRSERREAVNGHAIKAICQDGTGDTASMCYLGYSSPGTLAPPLQKCKAVRAHRSDMLALG